MSRRPGPSPFLLKLYHFVFRTSLWLRNRFTYLGQVVLIFMLLSAAFGVDTAATTTYQLFTFLLALFFMAYINSLFTRITFTATRHLPRYFTVGERGHYKVSVENGDSLDYENLALIEQLAASPPGGAELDQWYQLSQQPFYKSTLSFRRWRSYFFRSIGGYIPEIAIPQLPARSLARKTVIDVEFTPIRRGRLNFDEICIASPDRLGLFRRLNKVRDTQSCLVLPQRYPVAPLKLAGKRKYQAGGISLANCVGDSSEFISLRDYRKGDPLNSIHWKSFARKGELVVKEYQDEYFARRALILDTFSKTFNELKFEAAVTVAASVCMSERETDSLLDLMFVGEAAHCFTSGRGVDHMPHIQEILASVQRSSAEFGQLEEAVMNNVQLCSSSVCVLMSWNEERKALVQKLQQQNIPLAVFLIHDGSLNCETIKDRPEQFHLIDYNRIAADLAAI
jgi:uncharacterized protein (DUF58 family)